MNIDECYVDLANAILAQAVEDVVQFKVLCTFHPLGEDKLPMGISESVKHRAIKYKFPKKIGGKLYKTKAQYEEHLKKQQFKDALSRYRQMNRDHDEALAFLQNDNRTAVFSKMDWTFFKSAIEKKYRMEMEWEFEKIFLGQPRRKYSKNRHYVSSQRGVT